jgi:hypothetical protein
MEDFRPIEFSGIPSTPYVGRVVGHAVHSLNRRKNNKLVRISVAGEADPYKALMMRKQAMAPLIGLWSRSDDPKVIMIGRHQSAATWNP